ncbi:MarR family winged helix-turn-helix transcriptional regulator [Zavarzinia aquatilis]|uniref:MarR family transcriptional regulator n=1 Tax=Zavarzinia aquatilis TaxID=2211142 RepID=A0A317EHT2_9PROT|nr:MarR family transcriptional regulator [Zavarzinia aquatilis]PWR25620.1 MarR family transcriptional regulator [Zavarzinia aquatilis]
MPQSPDPRMGFGALLGQTARLWRRAVDRGLHPLGLTEATWLPLVHLSRTPEPMRQKQIAAVLNLDGSAVVRLLDTLQAGGLIDRREDSDRRAKAITLTAAGQKIADEAEAAAMTVREGALAGVSEDDIATTARVLRRICATLQGEAES